MLACFIVTSDSTYKLYIFRYAFAASYTDMPLGWNRVVVASLIWKAKSDRSRSNALFISERNCASSSRLTRCDLSARLKRPALAVALTQSSTGLSQQSSFFHPAWHRQQAILA